MLDNQSWKQVNIAHPVPIEPLGANGEECVDTASIYFSNVQIKPQVIVR